MASPFNLFTTTSYTFQQLESGIAGNSVTAEWEATGVLKHRDGMVQTANSEAYDSSATLHVRPSEPFIATLGGHMKLVGQGVQAGDDTYRITGVREGKDFDTGVVEFYLCTLKKESLWDGSELPLE